MLWQKWAEPFPKQALVSMCLQDKSFENTVGKGEIACYEQFLPFPDFSTHLENFLPFSTNVKLSSANCFILEVYNLLFGKGLMYLCGAFNQARHHLIMDS